MDDVAAGRHGAADLRGALQRRDGQVGRMGIGGGLAPHRAQAEALGFIEARGSELAVVPDEAFGLALLDEEFAVLGALQRVGDDGLRLRTAEIVRN